MALEAKLSLRTAQRLVMTAALQQAIKLLPLSRLELIQRIQQEMLENPFLEEVATPEESDVELANDKEDIETPLDDGRQDFETDWEVYLQEEGSYENFPAENGRDVPSLESTISNETSLTDYLMWQLSLSVQSDLRKHIGIYLIGNIDENGYLNCQTEEVSEIFGAPFAEVEDVLEVIQSFDPAGVGARDLRECLLIQLRHLDMDDSLASCIVRRHLNQIDERHFRKIARDLRAPLEDVLAAVRVIRELDPKPGNRYVSDRVEYIVPDVYVIKVGDDYQVSLNDDGVPKLNVNAQYQRLLRRDNGLQEDAKDYLEEKFRSAVWLVKGIEQRRQTLMKVSKSLCMFQRNFLEKGLAYLNPLVLKNVADDIGMHESTVSRVTTNKYIHTPQGVFELKFFFHSGLKSFEGDAMSSVSVKDTIRKMVGAEDARKPLTDQQLVAMLEDKNIDIARRTVAKYRQELHIPPASRRRRFFDA